MDNDKIKASEISKLPPAVQARINEAVKGLETMSGRAAVTPPAAEPPADSNAALIQKQSNQEKVQAALSPTDHFKGVAATAPKPPPTKGRSR
jgi:hypothetical protein